MFRLAVGCLKPAPTTRRCFSLAPLSVAPTGEMSSLGRHAVLSKACVSSVSRGCIVSISGALSAPQGSMVDIASSVPGVGIVRAQVLRVNKGDTAAALLAHGHEVAVGDSVIEHGGSAVPTFPCGAAWLGRVVSVSGDPLDAKEAPLPEKLTHTPITCASAKSSASAPSIAARASEGAPLVTGVKHLDLFYPLRRGMRVAFAGESHNDLASLAAQVCSALVAQNGAPTDGLSQPSVVVWAAVGQSSQHRDRVRALLAEGGASALSTIIFAEQAAPPLTQHHALLAAAAQASHLRALGLHALLVLDDAAAHARALEHLLEGAALPATFAVGSEQARILDAFAPLLRQCGGGATTAIVLAPTQPTLQGIERSRSDAVHAALRGTVDFTLDTNAHLGAAGIWPPVEAAPTVATLRYSFPAFRALVRALNAGLARAREAYEGASIGNDLGLVTDDDILEVIEWRPKVQVLLAQPQGSFIPLHAQYLPLFAALRPRMLAGIPVRAVRGFEEFICARADSEQRQLMARLRTHILASAAGPALGSVGALGLPSDLDADLGVFCDSAVCEYAATVPAEMFDED